MTPSPSRRVVVVTASLLVLGAAAVLVAFLRRPLDPPGTWMPNTTLVQKRLALAKEVEWADQTFTPIRDSDEFRQELDRVNLRLDTSLAPKLWERFRELLFENLVCRQQGNQSRYSEKCVSGRPAVLDQRNRDAVTNKYKFCLGKELPAQASAEDLFEEFWRAEYLAPNEGKRFAEAALGPSGALIIISELTNAQPTLLLTTIEQNRWYSWPGARRHGSVAMHPGSRSLEDALKIESPCKFAEVVFVIRTQERDILCWWSQWFLDPVEDRWELVLSLAVNSRRRYAIPI